MPLRSLGHRAPLLWLAVPFAIGLVGGRCGLAPVNLALTLGAAAALIGVVCVAGVNVGGVSGADGALGVACALLAAALWAGYIVLGKRVEVK